MGNYLSRITVKPPGSRPFSRCLPGARATSEWKDRSATFLRAVFRFVIWRFPPYGELSARSSARSCWNDNDVTKSTVDVTIDVSTVGHTRGPPVTTTCAADKFFDVAHFPTMTFKSKKVAQLAPGKLKVYRRPHHSRHHQGSRA